MKELQCIKNLHWELNNHMDITPHRPKAARTRTTKLDYIPWLCKFKKKLKSKKWSNLGNGVNKPKQVYTVQNVILSAFCELRLQGHSFNVLSHPV